MEPFQRTFIELALGKKALGFGEFTLKSGRISPYFFNAGCFDTGNALASLGACYAAVIDQSGIEFDILFGPAYKGIPLAAVTAAALARDYNCDRLYAFNRKEAKDHGEGGSIVGAPLQGRVLVIDDVITAGTALREVASIIQSEGAELAGVVIGLDRQERGTGELSAIQEVEEEYSIPVLSIVQLAHILAFLEEQPAQQNNLQRMQAYRTKYGIVPEEA